MEVTIILNNGNKHALTLSSSDSVKSLKQRLAQEVSVPDSAIRLFFSGAELKPDSKALSSFDIGKFENWNIHATVKVVDLSGASSSKPTSSSSKKDNQVIDLTDDADRQDDTIQPTANVRAKRKRSNDNHEPPATSSVIDLTSTVSDLSNGQEEEGLTNQSSGVIDLDEETVADQGPSMSRGRRTKARRTVRRATARSRKRDEEFEFIPVEASENFDDEPTADMIQQDAKKEVRAARFRTGTYQDELRVQRALSQRLYLLNQANTTISDHNLERQYDVLGSTGNVYKICIGKIPTCDCPDFMNGNICKHIIFVMVKVLRVPVTSHIVHQRALLQSELREIFAKTDTVALPVNVAADSQTIRAYKQIAGIEDSQSTQDETNPLDDNPNIDTNEDSECPICFETILVGGKKESFDDCSVCKIRIHRDCMNRWMSRGTRSCPQCRSGWRVPSSSSSSSMGVKYHNGYVNLRA